MPSTITVPVGQKPNITVMTISARGLQTTTHPNGVGNPTRGDRSVVEEPAPEGVAVEDEANG